MGGSNRLPIGTFHSVYLNRDDCVTVTRVFKVGDGKSS